MKTYRLNEMMTDLIDTIRALHGDEKADRTAMDVELKVIRSYDKQYPGPVNEESLLATNAAAIVACIERAWPGSIDLARRMEPADPWEEIEPQQEAWVRLQRDNGHWYLWVDGAVYQLGKDALWELIAFKGEREDA